MDKNTLLGRASGNIDQTVDGLRGQSVGVVRADQEKDQGRVERVLSDESIRQVGLVEPLHQKVKYHEEHTRVQKLTGRSRAVLINSFHGEGTGKISKTGLNGLVRLRERDAHKDDRSKSGESEFLIVDKISEPISSHIL